MRRHNVFVVRVLSSAWEVHWRGLRRTGSFAKGSATQLLPRRQMQNQRVLCEIGNLFGGSLSQGLHAERSQDVAQVLQRRALQCGGVLPQEWSLQSFFMRCRFCCQVGSTRGLRQGDMYSGRVLRGGRKLQSIALPDGFHLEARLERILLLRRSCLHAR